MVVKESGVEVEGGLRRRVRLSSAYRDEVMTDDGEWEIIASNIPVYHTCCVCLYLVHCNENNQGQE